MNSTLKKLPYHVSTYFAILFAVMLAGCGGGGGSSTNSGTDGGQSNTTEPLPTSTSLSANNVANTIQDIWLFQSLQVITADGTLNDITTAVIDSLQADSTTAYPLYGSVTFSPTTVLQPRIVDESGSVRDHINVVAGIMSDGTLSALAVVATPDLDAGSLVERKDKLDMDLSQLSASVSSGDVLVTDYFFAVTLGTEEASLSPLTPDDPLRPQPRDNHDTSEALDSIALLVERIEQGNALVEAFQSGENLVNEMVNQGVGHVREEVVARMDAKSSGLLDGLSGGATECLGSPGIQCVDKLFESVEGGFEKSLDAIMQQFPSLGPASTPPEEIPEEIPEPFDSPTTDNGDDDPLPDTPDLCTGFCGIVANDPHIKTFDGRHYSPQPVGEMTALLQTAQSGIPLEMQWRFGALNNSRFASVVTAVAFGFGELRITLDIQRDVLIAINGEPLDLKLFPQGQLISSELGLVLADRLGIVELEYGDWLFSIRPGANHLNVTASAQQESGDVVGLLGNLDGNPDNDLVSRNGSAILTDEATLEELYSVFLNSWRVTDETSLFDYAPGESTATFTDLTFPTFPQGVAASVTLASEFSPTTGLDTRQAEGACRRAGISDEPQFGNCVTDYVLSGSTEYIVGQQQALDTERRDRVNRFGSGLNGRDMIWWQLFEGDIDNPLRAEVVSNGRILLVRSRDVDRRSVVDAIDGLSGRKLWRLEDTQNECTPLTVGQNLVVLQADSDTDLGGGDGTDDVLLVDINTGEVLDTWAPNTGLVPACTAPLQMSENNTLVLVTGTTQRGLSVADNQLSLLWELRLDGSDTFSAGRNLDLEAEAFVKGNNLFRLGEDESDDGSQQYSVYQIDTETGVVVDRLPTSLTIGIAFLDAGESQLAVVQQDIRSSGTREVLLIETPSNNSASGMQVAWQRVLGEGPDTLVSVTGRAAAYSSDVSFGVWARDSSLQTVIAEFDRATGSIITEIPAAKFNDFDAIVRLQSGEFVFAPPTLSTQRIEMGDVMIQAGSAEDPLRWGIDRVEGIQYPATLHLLDNDRLVVVAPLTDVANDPFYTDWAVFAIGTRR